MKDKFVGRRGSQGNWRWEGDRAPDQPLPVTKVKRTPAASVRSGIRNIAAPITGAFVVATGAISRTVGSSLQSVRDWLEPYKPEEQPNLPGAEKPATAPPAPFETVTSSAEAAELPIADLPPPGHRRLIPAFRMPRVTMPHVSRPRLRRSAVVAGVKLPEVSEEMRAPLTLFTALGLAAALSIAIAILVAVLDNDSSDGRGGVVPNTSSTPEASADPAPSESPTTQPSATPPPVAPSPQPGIAIALWSNVRNEWWFGDLGEGTGNYAEGQLVPILTSWPANPGQTYNVSITYDCATDDALGAIDYLSGIDTAGTVLLLAPSGPGRERPDAAVPVPDTADFAPDDNAFGVAYLFGGRFGGIPATPQPAGACGLQRTLSGQVVAQGTQVYLLFSGHLATAAVWGAGEGAASHDQPFGVEVSVIGLGTSRVDLTPDAVIDIP